MNKRALRTAVWNCNKGLVDHTGGPTDKVAEIENFIIENDIHIMGILESSLHGKHSNTIRTTPMTNNSIRTELYNPGYDILLPESWTHYDVARILVYIRNDIKVVTTKTNIKDLPIITMKAKKGEDKDYVT